MYKIRIFFVVVILFAVSQLSVGQNNTNSPYTRFGYGDVTESVSTESRGKGGIAIGTRSSGAINPENPASYSSVDSLTFMFDVATSFRYSRFSSGTLSNQTLNANLEYITMRFPVAKNLGISAGLIPYSFLGYNFLTNDSVTMPVYGGEDPKKIYYTQTFTGAGGFSQVYAGLAYKAFDHISLGVNCYYLFGNISNSRSEVESNSSSSTNFVNNQLTVSDVRLRYGLQFFNTFNKRHNVTLGLIYENKTKLNGSFTSVLNNTTLNEEKNFELPQMFGVGANYTLDGRLSLGIDYKTQAWGDALFFGKTDSLVNSSRLAVGAEYIPNPYGRKISDRVIYRIGLNTSSPYYKVGANQLPKNYGLSLGIGLPIRDNFTNKVSYINASLEYGKIGSTSKLREDYFKLTISASMNELWFFKRKL
ncbi:MAG: hypothetical protein ACK5L7_07705 [Paludibacteraceae bacterium]